MLGRFARRLAPRAKNHDELVKLWKERPTVKLASEESGLQFRDTRPAPPTETDEAKRRRLLYQSEYRGMVEMDIILGLFARKNVERMPREELDEYDALLRHFDNDLFKWLVMGETPPSAVTGMKIFGSLKEFMRNDHGKLLEHIV